MSRFPSRRPAHIFQAWPMPPYLSLFQVGPTQWESPSFPARVPPNRCLPKPGLAIAGRPDPSAYCSNWHPPYRTPTPLLLFMRPSRRHFFPLCFDQGAMASLSSYPSPYPSSAEHRCPSKTPPSRHGQAAQVSPHHTLLIWRFHRSPPVLLR
jgi:hypothetical protein